MGSFKKPVTGLVWLIVLLLAFTGRVVAETPPTHPGGESNNFVYTVQPGDTLVLIALRFNVSLAEVVLANDLFTPNFLFPGQQLVLPGVVAPPSGEAFPLVSDRVHTVQSGDTLFSIAGFYGVSTGELIGLNQLINPDMLQIGQLLHLPVGAAPPSPSLTLPFKAIELSEPTIIQGRVLTLKVHLAEEAVVGGSFEDQPLFFGNNGSLEPWTLVPIHAMMEPGIYPVMLTATLADGETVSSSQNIEVVEGPYAVEAINLANDRAELLNPELVTSEQEKMIEIWSQVSPNPRWEGPFRYPVEAESLRITSDFGTRRSYNGSEGASFHGGTDFGGGTGTPIYAPAAGKVVLAEPLMVRGNAVLIDHGLGLYSGYWHQSQIVVQVGQEVQPGDLIGYIGDTGLVTGPHLHWEMRLNGIAVEPLQWVMQSIP
jgi:murein DD-endopeptidase MepM/ murein hydrolase activator NlpD